MKKYFHGFVTASLFLVLVCSFLIERPSSAQKKGGWEYKVWTSTNPNTENKIDSIAALGDDGWELAAAYPYNGDSSGSFQLVVYVFKRPRK